MIVSSASALSRSSRRSRAARTSSVRFDQQSAHPDDRVHRRADLVAHGGEECALGGFACSAAGAPPPHPRTAARSRSRSPPAATSPSRKLQFGLVNGVGSVAPDAPSSRSPSRAMSGAAMRRSSSALTRRFPGSARARGSAVTSLTFAAARRLATVPDDPLPDVNVSAGSPRRRRRPRDRAAASRPRRPPGTRARDRPRAASARARRSRQHGLGLGHREPSRPSSASAAISVASRRASRYSRALPIATPTFAASVRAAGVGGAKRPSAVVFCTLITPIASLAEYDRNAEVGPGGVPTTAVS